eukprot:scaffold34658_cov230-Amphora_coffeaeformis.AAC.5
MFDLVPRKISHDDDIVVYEDSPWYDCCVIRPRSPWLRQLTCGIVAVVVVVVCVGKKRGNEKKKTVVAAFVLWFLFADARGGGAMPSVWPGGVVVFHTRRQTVRDTTRSYSAKNDDCRETLFVKSLTSTQIKRLTLPTKSGFSLDAQETNSKKSCPRAR